MSTLNATMSLARRALIVQQGAISVLGNNIANESTPGYARQRVNLVTAPSTNSILGAQGTGVDIASIETIRDPFIEQQFRRELGQSGWFGAEYQQLSMVESCVGELGDSSLEAALDRFWNSWQDLSVSPAAASSRSVVRESARTLITQLGNVGTRLDDQLRLISEEIASDVDRINAITSEIAQLNRQYSRLGDNSGLDDRRTLLLDELATLTGCDYRLDNNGSVTVIVGGVSLVEGASNRTIDTARDQNGFIHIHLSEGGGDELEIGSGEIGALKDVLEGDITEIRSRLDDIAVSLVREVNRLHREGYGLDGEMGRNFFDPNVTGIHDFALSDDIENSLDAIAASSDGSTGNNQIALSIAELANQPISSLSTNTLNDALRSTVSWIGARVTSSDAEAEGSRLVLEQISAWRDSVSGVSLDEEMAKMVEMQNAYAAAAKLINTLDEMFTTIFNLV